MNVGVAVFINDEVPDNIHLTPLTGNVKQTVSILIEWNHLCNFTSPIWDLGTASHFKEKYNNVPQITFASKVQWCIAMAVLNI